MQQKRLTLRLIWLAMIASVLIPCLIFAFASWVNYRNLVALNDERLIRSLDVQQEESQKTFQLVELALTNTEDLIVGMSDADIRSNEPQLHRQLKKLVDQVSSAQSIWIYGEDGGVLASSWVHPVPPQNFSDRDFFSTHAQADRGIFYGRIYDSQYGAQPFFTVSKRFSHDGKFAGVIEVSVLPSNFFRFFSKLAYTEGLQYGLIRDDGWFLARYPPAPPGVTSKLDEKTGFHRAITEHPEGALFESTSPIDHVERRYAIRRFGDTQLYLSAGIARSTIRNEWIATMSSHLIFGIPATLLLFLTLVLVLRRTQRLYAEMDHRFAAEESLRQAQKLEAVGHLTGGVAHDFNNLLTIIIGNLENAQHQMGEWTDAAHAKLAQRIGNAMHGAQRAATLTKRLLAFSRQQPLNPVTIDVNRVLNGLSDFLRRTLGEDISLEIVGAAGVWLVEADAAELEAAVLNLAVNARDAMRGGGKLTIETSNAYLDDTYCRQNADVKPGQYVQISVTDTGTGMTREIIERAFEPFFTTKDLGEGTGLGLSQVYGFVKQSGGHVKIYSEVGEGTTVKIYLRRFVGVLSARDEPKVESSHDAAGECILVVEDDGEVRAYIVETLESFGYKVLEASSGENALEFISRNQAIDLLLTDVVMPEKNGRVLAKEAQERRPGLKVLFMTGYSRNAIVHQGRLDPDVDLLQKPITSQQLAAAVRKVLDA